MEKAKCKWRQCNEKATVGNGYCDRHSRKVNIAMTEGEGGEIGVYFLELKGRIYVGMTDKDSFKKRNKHEINCLIRQDRKGFKCHKFHDWLDELCKNEYGGEYGKDKDKELRRQYLERNLIIRREPFRIFLDNKNQPISDEKVYKEMSTTFQLIKFDDTARKEEDRVPCSLSQRQASQSIYAHIHGLELKYIKELRDFDEANGTNILLNENTETNTKTTKRIPPIPIDMR